MTNAERFKANIRLFEFEPHSYCNRKCWFCPNSFLDRQGPVKFFDMDIYKQVIADLASIDYSEALAYAGWCEPMSQFVHLRRMVYLAKQSLPNAKLFSNTNTDYISTENVQELADAGLGVLKCQLYFGKDEEYTDEAVDKKMARLKNKLPGIEFKEEVKGKWFALVGDLIVMAYAKDFHRVGHNRCDIKVREPEKRYQICYETVCMFGINHNGMAVPCCNIRSDYPPHKDVLLGQVDDTPGRIFELYKGILIPDTQYPCNTCMGKQGHADHVLVFDAVYKELKERRDGK